MNTTIRNFLIQQGIDITSDKFEEYIDTDFNFNRIISKYVIYKNTMSSQIPIANVRGNAESYGESSLSGIAELLGNFFNENGTGYESRSLGMLEYSSDEVVDQLRRSFTTDPMYVDECGDNSYKIGQNGMHRYHILKFHYLKERLGMPPEDENAIKALNEKYTIDYQVKHIDYTKTYCAYFLDRVKQCNGIWVENELVNFEKTGNAIVTQVAGEETKSQIMDDDSLVSVTRDLILRFLANPGPQVDSYLSLWEAYLSGNSSFKMFLSEKMPEVLDKVNIMTGKTQNSVIDSIFSENSSVQQGTEENIENWGDSPWEMAD